MPQQTGQSWEPIHQRLMQEFWGAINANSERIEEDRPKTPSAEYQFELPEGFPEGSQAFFANFAHGIVHIQIEQILRNSVDAVMTSVAKEAALLYQEQS
jgi:hypothetical protein